MSGGVDSSMAAALMLEAGHEVIGMTMRLYDASGDVQRGRGGTCCSPAEVDLARRVSNQLGFPHYTVDETDTFRDNVIDPFARDYAAGRTPNPCTRCNQHVKFGPLLRRAAGLGADLLVTGHYARVEDGALLRGLDPTKDQSYFLFAMGRDTLSRVAFPLGTWTKEAARDRARALGLPNADAPDSQELCFVPGGDHGEVVARRLRAVGEDAGALGPGPVVDEGGAVVGEHEGIHRVTVGQRRGLRVPGTERRYVLRVVPDTRTVVVGPRGSLGVGTLEVGELQDLGVPGREFRADVQVRHRAAAFPARVTVDGDGSRATVIFDDPVEAVAPGQAAVAYVGDRVVAGGWIQRAG
jgi:tRNA-specific 2-thiouridylase